MTTHIQLQTSNSQLKSLSYHYPYIKTKIHRSGLRSGLGNSEGRGGRVIHKYVGRIYDVFWSPGDLGARIDQDKWLPNQSLEHFTSSI